MKKNIKISLTLMLTAPAFVGAVAQLSHPLNSETENILSGLVKSVQEAETVNDAVSDIVVEIPEYTIKNNNPGENTSTTDESLPDEGFHEGMIVFWGDEWDEPFTEFDEDEALSLTDENESQPEVIWGDEELSFTYEGPRVYWGDEEEESSSKPSRIHWGGPINDREQSPEEISLFAALDFMTGAYDKHDFYQSGYWGKKEHMNKASYYTGPMPELSGYRFCRPAEGRLTSYYGYRERFHRVHKGIDIALSVGDTVCAALPGVVSKVSNNPGGYGKYVILVHNNGMETRYGHLNAFLVEPGTKVEAGEPIALGGNTGNSTGPHLHFEIRFRGYAIDPLTLFDFKF